MSLEGSRLCDVNSSSWVVAQLTYSRGESGEWQCGFKGVQVWLKQQGLARGRSQAQRSGAVSLAHSSLSWPVAVSAAARDESQGPR